MLGTFLSVVLVRKTSPVQDPIHIPVQQAPLRVVFVQEILDIDNMWFSGTHLQSPALPSVFAGLLWWFQHISAFGPKVPLECILLYEQRCATQHHGAQRVWIKLKSSQSWAASDVNPKIMFIPKMINICGCMGLLRTSLWDPELFELGKWLESLPCSH